jgi:hypothetical protein
MLAQNLKTAADLGISETEFDALAKVLGMLERGEVKHVPAGTRGDDGFNMTYYGHCGTTQCIAGWADAIADTRLCGKHAYELPEQLDVLLWGPGYSINTDITNNDVSVDQAAIALRNYLTHGEPRWAEALAG